MPFDPNNPNLQVWLREEPTDPAMTKAFSRSGGFKGTALNATFVMKRLTAAFGPVGHGWGYDIDRSEVVIGGPIMDDTRQVIGHEAIQVTEITFWYLLDGKRGQFSQVGQTTFIGYSRKNGYFLTDEEAWKKSLTDAITKAASHIGIGADIHLGMFDDNKYVTARRTDEERGEREIAQQSVAAEVRELVEAFLVAQDAGAYDDLAASVRILWPSLTLPAHRQALTDAAGDARKRLRIPDPKPKATDTGRDAA